MSGGNTGACGGSGRWQQRADVVVIGTGVAGLAAALAAHRTGRKVVVLSKASHSHGGTATFYAQGGIAVVLPDNDDSVEAHVRDTVAAGGGLCDVDAVRSIVAAGYGAVADLVGAGARFDEATPGRWSLTREGGHTRRRIIHAGGDATGAEVQRALDGAAAGLDIRSDHVAVQVGANVVGKPAHVVANDLLQRALITRGTRRLQNTFEKFEGGGFQSNLLPSMASRIHPDNRTKYGSLPRFRKIADQTSPTPRLTS